jgi:diacylglycerol kinase (ATP)
MRRLSRAFIYAWQGLSHTWRTQPNFRVETVIGLVALALAFWLGVDPVPILLLILAVLSLELLNTAIEAVCDYMQSDYDEKIGMIKDVAAAATAVVIGAWLLVMGIELYELMQKLSA